MDAIKLLRAMVLSRECDRREAIWVRQGRGWFHVASTGHEALAALAGVLDEADWLFPHYRDRALMPARGVDLKEMPRIFLGKKTAASGGRQLPGHYSWRALNIWSMPSPVGGNLLPAAGAAWAQTLRATGNVVLASVGDGGLRQGEFYESWAFAVEKSLPLVLLVEDNSYGISTCTTAGNPLRTGVIGSERVIRVDGRNVGALARAGEEAVRLARAGKGPSLLWCELDRLCSHSSTDDQRLYRAEADLQAMAARDPLRLFVDELIASGQLTAGEWEVLQAETAIEVEQAFNEVAAEADPEVPGSSQAPPPECLLIESISAPAPDARMLDYFNTTLRRLLEADDRVFVFGEDIEDPMGGVFKLTNGLSTAFPGRVVNSPLAEATIVGVACGMASAGMRPIFELQFIDFIGPAWNQVVTNLSTLRWRSNDGWFCPAVIYAPCGAYLPAGGPWHSQSLEAALAQIPGIQVVIPSTAEDAAGFLLAAHRSLDPVFILLPKHLLRIRRPVAPEAVELPFGRAALRRRGDDLTIVAWGNCVEVVEKALDGSLDGAVELIDLRSVVPWDREAILASVRRTGRLLVVQEDNQRCSVGEMILAAVAADDSARAALRSTPRLLARDNVHVPFHPDAEASALPSITRVAAVIHEILRDEIETAPAYPSREEEHHDMNGSTNGKHSVPILVPSIGEGLQEARVLKFFKAPGERVVRDEQLYQLETDKAVVDVESAHDGVVENWEVAEEAVVLIGSVIGSLAVGEAPTGPAPRVHAPAPVAHAPSVPVSPSKFPHQELRLSEKQQQLAARLVRAARIAVPATVFGEACWDGILAAREGCRGAGPRAAMTTFSLAAWCVCQAMKEHSLFRSSLPQDTILRVYEGVHIGVAVSLPDNDLAMAVVENAESLTPLGFAERLRERVEAARAGEDQSRVPATVILTSLAALDVQEGIPVIVPPAVATLLIGAPAPRVVLRNGTAEERQIARLALTIDHRVINGAGAAAFMKDVRARMEAFAPHDAV